MGFSNHWALTKFGDKTLMPAIHHLRELTPADRDAMVAPLEAYSKEQGFPWNPGGVFLALRDDEGAITGGLIGSILWEWLRIEILAVDSALRGQGWGRKLVEAAETLAVDAGCRGAWVDTFTFHSPEFYRRLGYSEFGRIDDYPRGQSRFFFSKQFHANQATSGMVSALPTTPLA